MRACVGSVEERSLSAVLAALILVLSPAQNGAATLCGINQQVTESDAPESIGVASMESDGTIVLRLRATDPGGQIAEGFLRYPPTSPDYNAILSHVGPLRPGETRPVAPWRD
jgi:hypothetical protein